MNDYDGQQPLKLSVTYRSGKSRGHSRTRGKPGNERCDLRLPHPPTPFFCSVNQSVEREIMTQDIPHFSLFAWVSLFVSLVLLPNRHN